MLSSFLMVVIMRRLPFCLYEILHPEGIFYGVRTLSLLPPFLGARGVLGSCGSRLQRRAARGVRGVAEGPAPGELGVTSSPPEADGLSGIAELRSASK